MITESVPIKVVVIVIGTSSEWHDNRLPMSLKPQSLPAVIGIYFMQMLKCSMWFLVHMFLPFIFNFFFLFLFIFNFFLFFFFCVWGSWIWIGLILVKGESPVCIFFFPTADFLMVMKWLRKFVYHSYMVLFCCKNHPSFTKWRFILCIFPPHYLVHSLWKHICWASWSLYIYI